MTTIHDFLNLLRGRGLLADIDVAFARFIGKNAALDPAMTLLAALVYELIPRQMLGLFDASENMLALGVPALRICAVSLPFGAMSVIFSSSYQSLGYSGLTLLVSVCRQMLFPLPIAWLLARSGILERVWAAVPAGELMTFVLAFLLARFVLRKAEEKPGERKRTQDGPGSER